MATPKTVTVTVEIVHDDGSKTILETAELDGTHLLPNRYTRVTDAPEHIVVGMVDPWRDDSDWFQRRDRYVDSFSRIAQAAPETHFSLNLQLPPVDKKYGAAVYTIREIEAPDTRVVMEMRPWGHPTMSKYTEVQIVDLIEEHGLDLVHFFFLDIP